MTSPFGAGADRLLVDACLAGEAGAWDELYRRCQSPLLVAVRALLGPDAGRLDLVEEIAARVWYLLIDGNGELLDRFDPTRECRLTTFMAAVAKHEISKHLRSERRRRIREITAVGASVDPRHAAPLESEASLDLTMSEFLATLTPSERRFCESYLLAAPAAEQDSQYSATNRWQLQHRVRRKLAEFVQQD